MTGSSTSAIQAMAQLGVHHSLNVIPLTRVREIVCTAGAKLTSDPSHLISCRLCRRWPVHAACKQFVMTNPIEHYESGRHRSSSHKQGMQTFVFFASARLIMLPREFINWLGETCLS